MKRQDKLPSGPIDNTISFSRIYTSKVETKENLSGFEHAQFSFVDCKHKLKKAEEKSNL